MIASGPKCRLTCAIASPMDGAVKVFRRIFEAFLRP